MANSLSQPLLKKWEIAGFFLLALALAALLTEMAVRRDYHLTEAAFLDRARGYERELYQRFGSADAILTSLAGVYATDSGLLKSDHESLSRKLLRAYPYIGSLARMTRTGATSADGETTGLAVNAMEPARDGLRDLIGTDVLENELLSDAAELALESGQTAISRMIATRSGGVGVMAIHPLYVGGALPPDAESRRKMLVGALALYIDSLEFFSPTAVSFDHLSIWLQDLKAGADEARPLFEAEEATTRTPFDWMLQPFVTAVRLKLGGAVFWISAKDRPSYADFRFDLILLAALGPFVVAALLALALRSHRRAHRQARDYAGKYGASERRFRDFAEASVDWFWEMDSELRFSYFSERFFEVAGVPPHALLGKTRRETGIPGVDPEAWAQQLDDLDAHRPFRDFIHPRIRPNGEQVWLAINGKPLFDSDGRFLGYRGTGRDITMQIRRERELAEARKDAEGANRAKSEFLANMSHELRTPLHAVIGFAQLLMRDDNGADVERAEFAKHIHDSGQHLLSLINDLLDISKIESGQDELRETLLDIKDIVRSASSMSSGRSAGANVAFIVDVPEDLPQLLADRRKVLQIMANLLSNAFKFTEEGGEVALRCHVDAAGRIVFGVVDSGIGMAPDEIPKAFAEFSQLDNALSRKFEGTGLGLPLTKRLIAQHGGEIEVESEVGVGTSFRIVFPAERTVRENAPADATARAQTA